VGKLLILPKRERNLPKRKAKSTKPTSHFKKRVAKMYMKGSYACHDCKQVYIADVMLQMKPTYYQYLNKKESDWYCLRCYNKRFR